MFSAAVSSLKLSAGKAAHCDESLCHQEAKTTSFTMIPSSDSEVQISDSFGLIGRWQYGGSKGYEYRIHAEGGELRFTDQKKNGVVSGILRPHGRWLQADLSSGHDGEHSVGAIRLRLETMQGESHIVSNFMGNSKEEWGTDNIAHKVNRVLEPRFQLSSDGIGKLPGFVAPSAAETAARVIQTFAMLMLSSPVLTRITGGRYEVFLMGAGSDPFQEFLRVHTLAAEVSEFLGSLKARLSDVAFANGGRLSGDIVALVGASEMQVPHVDLQCGQVQIITALTTTAPTLVYNPQAKQPTVDQAFEIIGVDAKHAMTPHLRYLAEGATALVLPVSDVFGQMVPVCDEFHAGDAVQISHGIVHAGPKSEERPGLPPRIVVFATYSRSAITHYDVEFQYKLWDWASFSEVPPHIAYKRLLDVYQVSKEMCTRVQPWVYYDGERAEACKTLCTCPGLADDAVEELVRAWRQ